MKPLVKIILATLIYSATSLGLYAQGSGNLLDFNGSSSYVNCGTVNLNGTSLTLMGWVKVDAFKSAGPFISSLWGSEAAGSGHAQIRLGDAGQPADQAQFVLLINGTNYKLNGTIKLQVGKWHHVAATYDGATMKLYIDGILDASQPRTGSVSSNSAFYIGYNYATSRILDGQMDEVSAWKAALSQTTIRNWMCKSINSSHPNYAQLEGYWKMNEGAGTTTADASGRGHTGTFVSSPSWQTSSAPIGEQSIADYAAPFNLKLTHADGDSMVVSNVTGNPSSVHLYLVNQKPNSTTLPSGIILSDTTRYWGVYYTGGSSSTSSLNYYYNNNSNYQNTGSCMIDMVQRTDNATTSWTSSNATQSASDLSMTAKPRNEYMLVYRSNKIINADTGSTVCDGDSVKLEHSTSGMTYRWYRNGSLIPSASSNTYYAKQAGVYLLTASLGSCTDTSYSYTLATQANPTVSFAPLSGSCPHVLFDTLSGGSPAGGKYLHQFASGNLFVVQNAGPGSHKIVYEYEDQFGCKDTASQIKLVHNWPAVSVSQLPSMCEDSNSFNLSNGTPTGGTFYVNGNATTSVNASVLGSGTHNLKYRIVDANGCHNADSNTFVVKPLPNVMFSVLPPTFCEFDDEKLIDGQNPRGGSFSGNGISVNKFNPQTAGVGKHPITYTYTDPSTSCSNEAIDTITVFARPNRPTITQAGDSLVSSLASSYTWFDKIGAIPNSNNQVYHPKSKGKYHVIVRENGCSSERSDTIDFDFSETTNVFAATNGTSALVYPNPANSSLTIELQNVDKEAVVAQLLSMDGKVVMEKIITSNYNIMDTEMLQDGIYVLRLVNNEHTISKRILINH